MKLLISVIIGREGIYETEDVIVTLLWLMTPIVNPILYVIFNKKYRQWIVDKVCGCCKWRPAEQSSEAVNSIQSQL